MVVANFILNIPPLAWILLGALCASYVSTIKKYKVPANTMQQMFFTFTFLLFIWNISFSFVLTSIASGATAMNPQDMLMWAKIFQIFAWIILGVLIGEMIVALIEARRNKRKEGKQKLETPSKECDNLSNMVTGIALITKAIINMTRGDKGKEK